MTALKENTQIYTKLELLKMKANDSVGSAIISQTVGSGQIARNLKNKVVKKSNIRNNGIVNLRAFFKPYNELLKKDLTASSLLQNANASLNKAYQTMTDIYGAVTPKQDAFKIVTSRIKGNSQRMVTPLNILPRHIKRLYKGVLISNWQYLISYTKEYINDVYKRDVLPFYKERIKYYYPISKNSNEYLNLDDFSEFFKEDGILNSFYKNYLSSFVKINANNRTYRFKNIDGASISINKTFMRSYLSARKIRKVFFKNNGELGFTASIKPHTLGNNLATMEFAYDNISLYYEHGPIKSQKIVWPPQSFENTVKFNLFTLDNTPIANLYEDNEWALFKILGNFKTTRISNNDILLKYNDSNYEAEFYLKGKISSIFTSYNSLSRFVLRDQI